MTIRDTNVFPLKGTLLEYFHLATIEHNLREFMCFIHVKSSTVFIEEITTGFLIQIEDDILFNDLGSLLTERGITDVKTIHQLVTAWKVRNHGAIEHDV